MHSFLKVPPEESGKTQTPEVIENNPLTLQCNASGIPRPTVTWFKNLVPISGNTSTYQLLDEDDQLHISNARVDDDTLFTCKAENVAGVQEKHFDVSVLGR